MNEKLKEVVIVAAGRTPIGKYKGSLANIKAHKLGSMVIKEVLHRAKLSNQDVDEVIMGQVLTAGLGQNPSRQAAINAGLPKSVPAYLVNQVCGSGLRAVINGFQTIQLNQAKCIISGGQENMSEAPQVFNFKKEKKRTDQKLIDTMIQDGLIDAFHNYHMGVTAENIAEKFKISRDEQDNFALKSQLKTQSSIKKKFI